MNESTVIASALRGEDPVERERRILDREMRAVLAQFQTISHVPAATNGGTGSPEEKSGARPPGDLGEAYWARKYGPPFVDWQPQHDEKTNFDREQTIAAARAELRQLRGRDVRKAVREETRTERDDRIVSEGEGFPLKEVARSFRCTEREVRKARMAKGREPDMGRRPERDEDADARRRRARELADQGFSIAYIARATDSSRSTIERDLGRRAA